MEGVQWGGGGYMSSNLRVLCVLLIFCFTGSEEERSRVEEIGSKVLSCYTVGFNRGFKVHLVFVAKPT